MSSPNLTLTITEISPSGGAGGGKPPRKPRADKGKTRGEYKPRKGTKQRKDKGKERKPYKKRESTKERKDKGQERKPYKKEKKKRKQRADKDKKRKPYKPRCPKGTKRNKETGECDKILTQEDIKSIQQEKK